jgi:hypothetical protein
LEKTDNNPRTKEEIMSQFCDCDDDFAQYQPAYVEAYIDNRLSSGQSIEDWTDEEGKFQFAESDIYAPVTVTVAISGSEYNGFSVDPTKTDWQARFQTAVKQALVESGLAKVGDVVALEDVRADSLAERSMTEFLQTPIIYPTVNGKRTIDMPQTMLGCAVPTPATHSINRDLRQVVVVVVVVVL